MATAAKPFLESRFGILALKLQEAAADDSLTNTDVCRRLSDQLQDLSKTSGSWCYYMDHIGDGESGDVIYSCGGDVFRAPYTIGSVAGKASCNIDTDNAIDVVPRTVYEEEADDQDHYAAMESAGLYRSKTEIPLYERFIGKAERKEAPSGSFAGKGKSFPILKPGDVMAAVRSIGRAGPENYDAGTLKKNIIAKAKAKGWASELPKAWQGDDSSSKESAVQSNPANGSLKLRECAANVEPIALQEAARGDYEIKLIAPGKGATGWYPADVLKRDGAKAFPAETKIYVNHQTEAQEKAEGAGNRDVAKFAGVLTKAAEYKESHPKGPGLYSRFKVFSDHAQTLDEKSPYLAMSINANGSQVMESGKRVFKEGVPLLASLDSGDSVDVVPIAGAGGLILQESARTNPTQEDSMDAAELKKLQESLASQAALNQRLLERAIRGDAREEALRILKGVSLVEAAKQRVVEAVTADFASLPVKDGNLDTAAFAVKVNEAAKAEGQYVAQVTGIGRVTGMGSGAPVVQVTVQEAEQRKADQVKARESRIKVYMGLGMDKDAAERTVDRYTTEAA